MSQFIQSTPGLINMQSIPSNFAKLEQLRAHIEKLAEPSPPQRSRSASERTAATHVSAKLVCNHQPAGLDLNQPGHGGKGP